ncbi:MAG TPA: ATP-dependent Clp protease adapter ClpS [Desulfurivibrio alkaliphilus]|uniref:ATP-dependent Clp protease adapter protein ClpS n=1 Tax=Desulfurivibrio alkaliphilus TaxID=427923 RepID=A0A7C2TI71_9BACT|nr:ATP-dependent Clp protease adapter ClpS [Desulfurivibrio alkaliphilus]
MSTKNGNQQDQETVVRERQELRRPPLYKVLLHNDDYTTMDFVVMVLTMIFHHPQESANRVMMQVHREGVGVAGIFPRDVAETKIAMVHGLARKHEYPLKCSIERE